MTVNLWKKAGKPTSYNPLPTGWNNGVTLDIGDYIVSLKVKSLSKSSFDMATADAKSRLYISNLTEYFKTYELKINNKTKQLFRIADYASKGDIIIKDIELIEKGIPQQRSPQTAKRMLTNNTPKTVTRSLENFR